MPKLAEERNALAVKRIVEPGRHAVGTVAGLCLLVKDTGAKSWVLRTMAAGRRVDVGLGGYPTVSLAQAVQYARETRDKIRSGINPVAERRANRKNTVWTFKKVAEDYIATHRAGWKNAKHAQQWENTLETYANPTIGDKHVADVTKADVLAIIEPYWSTKNETVVRVRNRIELILAYATQREYRPDTPNPARWKGNLDATLPKASTVNQREHFAALPVDKMHGFMEKLRKVEGISARALEFGILTATRSGEVRGATWSEFDMDAGLWTIPAERMKAKREHRVPLNAAAIELIEALPKFDGVNLVFPGRGDKPLSDMSLTAVLRRMKINVTAHGFRSTFRDWAAERTNTPSEVVEMALAHAIGDKTEAAYRRGDLFEKRRVLMDGWQTFVDTKPEKGNVHPLRRKAG